MPKAAQKNSASTQKFIEIKDVVDNIVVIASGRACIIIEVKATNFALLSAEEQDAKIYAYASLLNSLSFPIQIVIRSRKLDISSYLKLLDDERRTTQNQTLAKQIGLYKDFVAELVKVNTILDKKFYISIAYSTLEQGVKGAKKSVSNDVSQSDFMVGAKASLHSKSEGLLTQLNRLNLKAEILDKEKATKLFYEIFNDSSIDHHETEHATKTMTQGKENS